ncbi:two-component system, HptB-dependent secretion and biofilm response regulator [Gammaproteobacteria bacterium]
MLEQNKQNKQNRPKILIVDDVVENIQILVEGLRDDYRIVPALSGEKALAIVEISPRPDLILLDVMMPHMDGFEVCRRLKCNPNTADIPIIFITAMNDARSEIEALTIGGVDFITKPIQPLVVKARIETHLALRRAYQDLAASNKQLRRERELIEDILLTTRKQPLLQESFIRTLLTPVERTAGDVFFLRRRPDGYLHAFIGDCTGHGLPAAIVGPMVMDIFHVMTSKGFPPEAILLEINNKLLHHVPANIFMAGSFLELTPGLDSLYLWNGGMPDVLFLRGHEWFLTGSSDQLPLGVVPTLSMDNFRNLIPLQSGDRIYLYSDGVVETKSPCEEMFGIERLKAFLMELSSAGGDINQLLSELNAFRGEAVAEDDITVVEILIP